MRGRRGRGHRGRVVGVECKRTDTPRITPSIRHSLSDLGLDRVWIVYPGDQRIQLDARVEALPIAALADPKLAFEIA